MPLLLTAEFQTADEARLTAEQLETAFSPAPAVRVLDPMQRPLDAPLARRRTFFDRRIKVGAAVSALTLGNLLGLLTAWLVGSPLPGLLTGTFLGGFTGVAFSALAQGRDTLDPDRLLEQTTGRGGWLLGVTLLNAEDARRARRLLEEGGGLLVDPFSPGTEHQARSAWSSRPRADGSS